MLSLDTSGGEMLVALVDAIDRDRGFVEGVAVPGGRHQDSIIDAIGEVTAAAGLVAIDAVAVARGPGSHTGLRVGLSTAEGVAYARRLPLYPLSSLAVAAHRTTLDAGDVVAVVAAGRGRVYSQRFTCRPGVREPQGAPRLSLLADLGVADAVSGESNLMTAAADLGIPVAPVVGGAEALCAATLEALGSESAVAYHEIEGDYGDQVLEITP